MSKGKTTREVKKRLKKAGYDSSVRTTWGGIIPYLNIRLKMPDEQDTIDVEEMKKILAKVFGEEYVKDEFPVWSDVFGFGPPASAYEDIHDMRVGKIRPYWSIQEREAEAAFGWRDKKFFCSCTAYYDTKRERNDCMQSH